MESVVCKRCNLQWTQALPDRTAVLPPGRQPCSSHAFRRVFPDNISDKAFFPRRSAVSHLCLPHNYISLLSANPRLQLFSAARTCFHSSCIRNGGFRLRFQRLLPTTWIAPQPDGRILHSACGSIFRARLQKPPLIEYHLCCFRIGLVHSFHRVCSLHLHVRVPLPAAVVAVQRRSRRFGRGLSGHR